MMVSLTDANRQTAGINLIRPDASRTPERIAVRVSDRGGRFGSGYGGNHGYQGVILGLPNIRAIRAIRGATAPLVPLSPVVALHPRGSPLIPSAPAPVCRWGTFADDHAAGLLSALGASMALDFLSWGGMISPFPPARSTGHPPRSLPACSGPLPQTGIYGRVTSHRNVEASLTR